MNGTTKLQVIKATEAAKGKKGKAYRDSVNAELTPEKIAASKPEHFPKEKSGKMK